MAKSLDFFHIFIAAFTLCFLCITDLNRLKSSLLTLYNARAFQMITSPSLSCNWILLSNGYVRLLYN